MESTRYGIFILLQKILKTQKRLKFLQRGNLRRDFTFINDVVASIDKLIIKSLKKNKPFFEIFNIGNNNPIKVNRFIQIMEKNLDKKSKKIFKKTLKLT